MRVKSTRIFLSITPWHVKSAHKYYRVMCKIDTQILTVNALIGRWWESNSPLYRLYRQTIYFVAYTNAVHSK
jgi:hypothetical protein